MNLRSITAVCVLTLCTASGAAAQTWSPFGPNAGEVPILIVSPSQGSNVLAIPGNDYGGLFLSTNSGTTWTPITRGICDAHVNDALFHPTQPSTIYVATMSGGVCRSTDSGATWTVISTGLPANSGYPRQVRVLAIDPVTPATMLAGTDVGIYRSTDGGANWALAGASGSFVADIEFAKSGPAKVYAMTSNGAMRSITGGAVWNPGNTGLPTNLDEGFLTVDPTDPNIAFIVNDTVYKTTNGGTNWAPSNTGLGSPFFFSNVTLSPTNHLVAYVNAIGGSGFSKSTDGGATWTPVNPTGLPDIPEFGVTGVSQVMDFEPGSNTNLYAGSPAGAFRSTNGGTTWSEITNNLTPRKTVAPVVIPATGGGAGSVLLARQTIVDGSDILKLTAGSLPFSSVPSPLTAGDSGNIAAIAVDPSNSSTLYLLGGKSGGQNCPQPYKSTNGGTSWTLMNTGIAAGACGTSIAIDPATPETVYISTTSFTGGAVVGLYKSINGGGAWTPSNTGMTFGNRHVAISAQHPNLLYAANFNQVFKSTNSGATWTNMSTGLPSSGNVGISRIVFDPTNDQIVYAATGAGVYQTTNGATSWTARTTGWPSVNGTLFSVAALAIDPTAPATLLAGPGNPANLPPSFLGLEARGLGLYRSTDSGATWTLEPGPIGGVAVNDIVFDGNRAAFATTNNGIFKFAAAGPPTMTLDKSSLVFTGVTTGAAFSSQTSAQTVRLTQTTTAPAIAAGSLQLPAVPAVTWTAASSQPWLVVSPASGSGSALLSVSVQFVAGLAATQTGTITLTYTGASNATATINVTLNTITSTAAAAPFGSFDTPTTGATGITGSIGVTGWIVDDVEVVRVRVMRDPVAPEPAGALVFIGDAVLVDGARPDIEATFPNLPRSSRAGWGYLMLTNFLPSLGNGTFKLYAIAEDADGHTTTLGPVTITCSNSTATAPFGAIDTPIQGGTASGTLINFGWVLGPNPYRADPPGGGQVRIVVDGAFITAAPGEWTHRDDLSALFPVAQYPGVETALGVAALDTTTYANGVHTIAWVVTDNNGSTSGVGSRFFTVSNGALMLDPSSTSASRRRMAVISGNSFAEPPSAALFSAAAPENGVVIGRRGFDADAPMQTYAARNGQVTVQAEELDRVELQLAAGDGAGGRYVGYLRKGAALAPLPAGSLLNEETGEFTWLPGVAFVGAYDFLFARMNGGTPVDRREVRVVLNPKGSNRVGTQTVIDIANGEIVAGWAADLDSQFDRGVDTVHVWAYPAEGGDPIFVGAAAFGGKRPDVAAVYGDRFRESGYGIRLDALPAGTYDIAVFAYSTVLGHFVPARTARVVRR